MATTSTTKQGKKGFIKRLRKASRSELISDGEFRVLFVLASTANDAGMVWLGQEKLAKESKKTKRGIQKILAHLEQKQLLRNVTVAPGQKLPSGIPAKRQRTIQILSEAICGISSNQRIGVPLGEQDSSEGTESKGESDSPLETVLEGERGSPEHRSPLPLNAVLVKGEPHSPLLRDLDLKNENEDQKHTTANECYAKLATHLFDMSSAITRNEPLDPEKLRKLVNECVNDSIVLPKVIAESISKLEARGWLERTKTSSIESVGWTTPTSLHDLMNSSREGGRSCHVDMLVTVLISLTVSEGNRRKKGMANPRTRFNIQIKQF